MDERRKDFPKSGDELREAIDTAVFRALVNKTMSEHETRLTVLERFRIWLLTAVAIGSVSSLVTMIVTLTEKAVGAHQ